MESLAMRGYTKAQQMDKVQQAQSTQRRRRRTLVAIALCWGVGASLGFHLWNTVASAGVQGVSYTVEPGDTVWSIASQLSHGLDPRTLMGEVIADNHLDAAGSIHTGEVLRLPAQP